MNIDQRNDSEPRFPRPRARWLARLALALLGLYCAWTAIDLFGQAERFQFDFQVYTLAARVHAAGRNPYDTETLTRYSNGRVRLPFLYPAPALYLFRPLTWLAPPAAARVYLVLKFLAIAALILLWRRVFFAGRVDLFFYFFCLLGFNAAIFIDVVEGNISVFEQLALWGALACLLRRRLAPFAALIVLAALFKVTWIVFLGLPLLTHGRRGLAAALGGAAAFGAVLGGSWLFLPFGREFWGHAGAHATAEGGILAPSTLAFIRGACESLAAALNRPLPPALPTALYVAAAALILTVSARAVVLFLRAPAPRDERALIFFACLVYALLLPRLKDYSYILLLAPVYAAARAWGGRAGAWLAALLLLAYPANGVVHLRGLSALYPFLINYFPWLIALAAWLAYLPLMRGDRAATRRWRRWLRTTPTRTE